MSRFGAITVSLAIAATGWAVASAQVQSVPGPGTGIVTVTGEVAVANKPVVLATQQGDWRVSLANTAPVTIANTPAVTAALPMPLKKGGRYDVVWASGDHEAIVVAEGGASAWVRVVRSADAGERWINLAAARSIAEIR